MDSLIVNALSSGDASNIHVVGGTLPDGRTSWDVIGYQDSSHVLVSVCITDGYALTCPAPKDDQTYQTKLINVTTINTGRYYGMGVRFRTSGTVSISLAYSITGYATAYMIIGIP